MEIEDVIKKLVGSINPVGESHTDTERFENLKVMCDLVNHLVAEIDSVHYNNKNAYEASRKRASEYAEKFITETLGITND